jgi:diguanylate cyclase (GGDEF)-like protein
VLTLQGLVGAHTFYPNTLMLLVLAAAGMQLRDLVSHAGSMQQPRRWLVDISLGLTPALAVGSVLAPWLLLPGLAIWSIAVAVVVARIWPQSRPWGWWLLPGVVALGAAAAWMATQSLEEPEENLLPVAGLLTVWSACVFLAAIWRSRILGETRVRTDARTTVDPLTGLATPLVLGERVHAARNLIRRYGHPSVLLLVHIDNLGRLTAEYGPEAAEAAVLAAATRVRQALREGDVAARVSHSQIAVLAEGLSPAEAAANVASRILVAGLKEPLPSLPAEFLHFRIVLGAIPVEDIPAKGLLQLLAARLELELAAPSERHIVTLAGDEMVA